MNMKGLVIALMLSVGASGLTLAETQTNVDAGELARTVVSEYHNDLLNRMQRKLSDRNEKKVKEFDKMSGSQQQFLYREDMVEPGLKAKSKTLKEVFGRLCKKENVPTKFHFEGVKVGNVRYKTFTEGKKQGQTDSLTLIVPVHFQTRTVDKNAASDVKYNVTFEWEVNVKPDMKKVDIDGKKQKVKVGYELKKSPRLISSTATPAKLLASEQNAMIQEAKQQIIGWYANLPQTLDRSYAQQAVSPIAPIKVTVGEIKAPAPEAMRLTITDVKDVTVEIDPAPFIKDNKELYTEPKAYKKITPTFNITFDNGLNNAVMTVTYKDTDVKPTSDREKEARRNAADKVITELSSQLSGYVTERDADRKSALSNMFADSDSKVEVSYLPKYGSEKIKSETARQYLTRLKGEALRINPAGIIVENPNWESVIYIVNQEYRSKTYNDCTQKRIHLGYDSLKNAYLIDKIEVVPNSTTTNWMNQ